MSYQIITKRAGSSAPRGKIAGVAYVSLPSTGRVQLLSGMRIVLGPHAYTAIVDPTTNERVIELTSNNSGAVIEAVFCVPPVDTVERNGSGAGEYYRVSVGGEMFEINVNAS